MDNTLSVGEEAQKAFCAVIRQLFTLLAISIGFDPFKSLQVVALLVWLEQRGFDKIVSKTVSFPNFLINDLAKEALTCLKYVCCEEFAFPPDENEIMMMQSLLDKRITLQHFYRNKENTILELNTIIENIYKTASLSDIMHKVVLRKNSVNLVEKSIIPFVRPTSQENVNQPASASIVDPVPVHQITREARPQRRQQRGQQHPAGRTLFVTFSKGYPVEEWEVDTFFKQAFGDCVEHIKMQDITEENPQALHAIVVLRHPSFLQMILRGSPKAKFTVNGKHIWMREFLAHHSRPTSRNTLSARLSNMHLF